MKKKIVSEVENNRRKRVKYEGSVNKQIVENRARI